MQFDLPTYRHRYSVNITRTNELVREIISQLVKTMKLHPQSVVVQKYSVLCFGQLGKHGHCTEVLSVVSFFIARGTK